MARWMTFIRGSGNAEMGVTCERLTAQSARLRTASRFINEQKARWPTVDMQVAIHYLR